MAHRTTSANLHVSGSSRDNETSPAARPMQTRDSYQLGGSTQATQHAPEKRSSILEELVNLIGLDAAAQLVEIFGGTRLYIPQTPEEDDLLTSAVGREAALRLAGIYGGDRIEVPNPAPRRMRIVELRESGCSIDAIARKLGCTRRRVFQVLAQVRAKRSA